MKHLLAIACTLGVLGSYGQYPGGGRMGSGGKPPSIGHFYGRIIDAKTGKGMDGASVQLIQSKFDTATKKPKDVAIAGMITERNGDFSLENLPIFGNFKLRVTAIGYKKFEQKVTFDLKRPAPGSQGDMSQAMNAVDKDLGNIKIEGADAQTLDQVTVTATKPLISLGVDKKVYNVEKDISAQGGTGVDVMRNVPSVQVDIDGNVTLRNSTPTILVDGLPTTLTLDQIPADAIQSIEIITNPGAKYDASGGTAGILNIILKKNRKAGYNGNVRAGVDERGKFNLGGDINMKQGKFNVFVNGNYGQRKSISPGTTNRYTLGVPTSPDSLQRFGDSLQQYDHSINEGFFAFGRAGVDYFLDNRNTISVSGVLVHGTFTPSVTSDIYVDTLFPTGTVSSYTSRSSNTNTVFNNHGGMLSYKHNFPKSGEELSANTNLSSGTNQSNNLVNSDIHFVKGGPLSSVYTQQQISSGDNKYFTAQADFTDPFSDKSKFEAGVRAAIRNVTSQNNYYNVVQDTMLPLYLLSSNYTYHDHVFAAYATYSNAIKDFSYQLGLRVESSMYDGHSNYFVPDTTSATGFKDTVGYFSNNYPISLFPSVFLTQKLKNDQELQLSYTRRIDRPSFFQLFPFTDYSDSLNISRGNPNLKPQFTNSLELAYQKTFPGNNVLIGSVYYKYTTDLITRFQVPGTNPITGLPVFVNTFINANSAFVGGVELIGRNSITKWWDLTTNINIYTSKLNVDQQGVIGQPESWSWYGKLNSTFKMSKQFTLQITGDYMSQAVLPPGGTANTGGGGRGFGQTVTGNAQGYSRPSGGVDASLKYEFLKNKAASLTLSMSDIFRTRVSDVVTQTIFMEQEMVRRRDPQFVRLQFNYRFGKFDVALFKRKNTKGDQDLQNNMQGANQ